jgi:hypothetical protein
MNNYIVLIAQNEDITTDMFDTDNTVVFDETNINENSFDANNNNHQPQDNFSQNDYQATSEIPALPAVTPERPSEIQTIMDKSSISFGILAIIIICILLFAFIYKKTRPAKQYKFEETEEEDFKENLETEVHVQEKVKPKKNKVSNLNTPGTIHNCIMSFLDITKEV